MTLQQLAEAFIMVSRSAADPDFLPDLMKIMIRDAGSEYAVDRESMNAISMFVTAVLKAQDEAQLECDFLDLMEEEYTESEYHYLNNLTDDDNDAL